MGILWPHSNTIARNTSDRRVPGALAYFFDGGTSTPRTTYSDADLTTEHTHPVVADAYGRFPAIFLDFGDYREQIKTPAGVGQVTLWDTDDIPLPTPFSEETGAASNSALVTGDVWFSFKDGTREGAVRCNGRTIGNAGSGATEHADADAQLLFFYLWDNLHNSVCPVSTGRGASALTDWLANKTIATPDLRGSLPGGLDTMGNSAASRFDASVPFSLGSSTAAGSIAGLNHHTNTIAQLPAITPAGTIAQITPAGTIAQITPAGTIGQITPAGTNSTPTVNITNGTNVLRLGGANTANVTHGGAVDEAVTITAALSGAPIFTGTPVTPIFTGTPFTPAFTGSAFTPIFTGTPFGSGAAHNNMPRAVLGTWFIKL